MAKEQTDKRTETTGAASTGQPVVEPKVQKSQASFFRCTFTWVDANNGIVRCQTRAVAEHMWVPGERDLRTMNGGVQVTSQELCNFVLCGNCVRRIREHDAKIRFFPYTEGLRWLVREEGRQSAVSAFAQRLTGSSQQRRGASAPWGEATPADVAAYREREREREERRPRILHGVLDQLIEEARQSAAADTVAATSQPASAASPEAPAAPPSDEHVEQPPVEAPPEDAETVQKPRARRPNGKRARRARQEVAAASAAPPNGASNGAAAMPAPTMACAE